jgi:hypothetical protein
MKKILLRWFWSLIEYLMFVPVILIIAGLTLPIENALIYTFTLPLHSLLAVMITVLLKKFKNLVLLILGIVYIFAVSCIWLITSAVTPEHMLLYILGTAFFFYWGIRRGIAGGSSMFFYTGGLVIHGLSLLIIGRSPVLNPLFNLSLVLAIFYVLFALPVANRHYLITESQQKNSLNTMPKSVIHGNWIIISAITILIGILSVGHFLLRGLQYLRKAFDYSVNFIWNIIEEISSFFQGIEGSIEPPLDESSYLIEENPVAGIISDIILATFLIFVVYRIIRYFIKNGKELIKNFIAFFSRVFNRFQKWGDIEKSYTDKQEFLIHAEKNKPSFKRRREKQKQWKDMKDNSSRTRFLYTRFVLSNIKNGYKFRISDTPSETVQRITKEFDGQENHELIGQAYNNVRYGIKELPDDIVGKLKDKYL